MKYALIFIYFINILILVPVESDLQEIVKEISIMKQCDSPYIVRYFGSYFKDADLWVKEIH